MPDILRVTAPVQGKDTATKVQQQVNRESSLNVESLINPDRVPKNDGKTLYNGDKGQFSPNLKSNFDTFLQRINESPAMAEELSKLFFTKFGSIVNSGMAEGIVQEMAEYMEMMKVTDAELLEMLKGLQSSSIKFTGSFFDTIRNLLNSGKLNLESERMILAFLKRYDALTATNHTLENIRGNLINISNKMIGESKQELLELINMLSDIDIKGDNSSNLQLLRERIIPLLAKYMTQVRDFGAIRENISLFVLNYAKYEIGNKEGFSESLNNLMNIPEVAHNVGKEMITEFVESIYRQANLDKMGNLQEKLVNILTQGLDGKAGSQNLQIFQNVLHSALLNESVYMPLLHMMLPVEYYGKKMFSEIWVDPNSSSSENGKEEGKAVKLFVKFDIQNLGFFEVIMLVEDKKVDMQLFYPEKLQEYRNKIKTGILTIIERNDMKFRSYQAKESVVPVPVSEVFPKIFEGRNVVNVTV